MTHSGPARAARSRSSSPSPGSPAARRTTPPRRLLAVIALIALLGAGCSTAPAGTGATSGENPAAGGDQVAPADATASPAEVAELQENLPEFAECMRENGVEDFPDPGASGIIEFYGDPETPEFTSASEKCDDLLPADRGGNR